MTSPDARFAALVNLRDVAQGLPAGAIRSGILLRSEAPMTGDDLPAGHAWPPATVIDLRSPGELGDAHPFAGTTTVHSVPLLAEAAPARLEAEPNGHELLAAVYLSLIAGRPAAGLVRLVDIVARSEGSVLIHCAAGKDRTGVAVALLLLLCGVERERIVEEYLRTNAVRDELLARLAHHARGPFESDSFPVLFAPRQVIGAVLDAWEAYPDGAAGWYLEHGGTPETIDALRRRLAVESRREPRTH